ncbi:hypothetical protein D4764_04G0010090 [Takifugu flavidus]|uniref:Uncharacterized protein n=1 Tax=Takifugu flavidus TaxID=433684 RepID=A0A5C6N4H1_9TELE|nr:hypothetical protein D4764_04G0010090 [Takifugu flavidus]
MDRLVRRASSVLGCPLDSVEVVGNGRMMAKLSSMLNNTSHPLQDTLTALGSSFSERLLHPRCVKERIPEERRGEERRGEERRGGEERRERRGEESYFFQLIRRDPQAFPDQSRDIVSPTCPGSPRGSPTGGTCPEHLTREASRGHPNKMPKPPHLAPLNAEEQRLYSELLPDGRASHPISKGEPSHPTEEAHFGRLYP